MSDTDQLQSKLHGWLKKQGYPLEMKVASAFRQLTNFGVRQGWHYQDSESGISREIDIVCTVPEPRGIAEINFVIECKGTTKPWVLFSSEDAIASYNRLTTFGMFSNSAHSAVSSEIFKFEEDLSFDEAKNMPWFIKDGMVGYSITQAFDGNRDVPYAGTLSSVKAALWLNEHSLWQSAEYRNFVVSFPIIVTSSPLFECYLDEHGESILKPINHGFLFFKQNIEGFKGTCISIVNEEHIEPFIKECIEVSEYLYKYLSPALEQDWSKFLKESNDQKPNN